MSIKEVLVVDDNPDVLFLAEKKLRAAGFEILTASDGIEALQQMIDHPKCRRMVTDFHMPGLGGNYWVRFLERFCSDWTVVVVSSSAEADPGSFVIVPKPADYANLVEIFGGAS